MTTSQTTSRRDILAGAATLGAALATGPALAQALPDGFSDRFADVNGTQLHYRIGGTGSPVVLLHGYAQTGHMWTPIMPKLAQRHTVIVPDLRGAGGSSKPEGGYDKKNMAVDIRRLTDSLGFDRVAIVGHDIGLMVAYAYAAQFPQGVERIILMDAFLPGIGNWQNVWLLRDLWHFHFYGEVPLALVAGRERIYFEHFWNDFAADRTHSVSKRTGKSMRPPMRSPAACARASSISVVSSKMRAISESSAPAKLKMPMLVITGEKASGTFLIDQGKMVADNVTGLVVAGSGHWLIDEAPAVTMAAIVDFLG